VVSERAGFAVSRIFLSHSSVDNRQAQALRQWLIAQDPSLANEIFLDLHPEAGIRPGERWMDALRAASTRCEAVICLVSSNWEASPFCKAEYFAAELMSKRVFSARLDSSAGVDPTRGWQQVDLFGSGATTSVEIYDGGPPVVLLSDGLARLREGIRSAGIGTESFPWPPPRDPERAPYRGWDPLDEADAAVFFGRDAQIIGGLDALRRMRSTGETLFVVLGPSGAGKSSFLRAGLLPRLRREDRDFVVAEIVRPQTSALSGATGFAAAVGATRGRFALAGPAQGDIEEACLRGDHARVREWLSEVQIASRGRVLDQTGDGELPTLVIPVDQAEELFGADAGEEAKQFMQLIADLANPPEELQPHPLHLIVALTIRADRYQELHGAEQLSAIRSVAFTDLKPMPRTLFKEVIEGPAGRAGQSGRPLQIEAGLVKQLLDDCTKGADTLPLLALTLSLLFTKYRRVSADDAAGPRLTLADYTRMGGIGRVVQTEIDSLLSADPTARATELATLRVAFIPWLATINPDPDSDQPLRRIARWSDLPPESQPLLERLIDRRLLVRDERGGEVVVEVALESLLREWDELAAWLAEDRERLRQADTLELTYRAWVNSGSDDWLLRGTRLTDAEALIREPGFRERLARTADLIATSRHREDERADALRQQQEKALRDAEAHAADLQRRSRILRIVLVGTATVAVLALVGAIVAWISFRNANVSFRQATVQRLVFEAEGILNGNHSGTDVQAFTEILAAQRIQQQLAAEGRGAAPSAGPILDGLVSRITTEKLIDVGGKAVLSALNPSGDMAAINVYGDVRLWNVVNGAPIGGALPRTGGVTYSGVAFNPKGDRIAVNSMGAHSGSIRLFDVKTHALLRTFDGPANQDSARVSFSTDGDRIAAGYADGTAWVWNVDSGARELVLRRGPGKDVTSVAFSPAVYPGGPVLVTGGDDDQIQLWDAQTGAPRGALDTELGGIRELAFDPAGALAVAGVSGAYIFNPAEGPDPIQGFVDRGLNGVAWNPVLLQLATADTSGRVKRWHLPTVDEKSSETTNAPLPGQLGAGYDVSYSADGSKIAAGGDKGVFTTWNPRADVVTSEKSIIEGIAFNRDGTKVAVAEQNGTIQLWDPRSTSNVGTPLVGHSGRVNSVAFDPAADLLAAGEQDGTVSLWGPDYSAPPRVIPGTSRVRGIAFSSDGTLLALAAGNTVKLWRPSSESPARSALAGPRAEVLAVAFSPVSHLIAGGSADKKIYIWDADTSELRKTLTTPSDVTAVAFGPDGRHLASGGADNSVQVWDVAAGKSVLGPLKGHTDLVTAVTYTAGGRFLISSSDDGRIIFWDSVSGDPVGNPLSQPSANPMLPNSVSGIALSPDGRFLVAGGVNREVRLWPGQPTPQELCRKLTVNPSREQWQSWIGGRIDYIPDLCPGLFAAGKR
jgi:WD40 repeat protein